MTISLVDHGKNDGGSLTSLAITLAGAQNAGDLIICGLVSATSTTTVSSVADTKGNSYAAKVPLTWWSTPLQGLGIYLAYNAKVATAGSNTVTLTYNATDGFPGFFVTVWRSSNGAFASDPTDVVASSNGAQGSGAAGSCTIVPGTSGDLIVGFEADGNGGGTAGTGYTLLDSTVNNGYNDEYKLGAASGSQSVTYNVSGATWAMTAIAIKDVTASGAASDVIPMTGGGRRLVDHPMLRMRGEELCGAREFMKRRPAAMEMWA